MYVPAWQGLTLRTLLARQGKVAPFPFHAPHRTAFHTARSAIYHLFRKLVETGRTKVLAPDYHMGNELRAIRAAGAQVELYSIGHDGRPDMDAVQACLAGCRRVVYHSLCRGGHNRSPTCEKSGMSRDSCSSRIVPLHYSVKQQVSH